MCDVVKVGYDEKEYTIGWGGYMLLTLWESEGGKVQRENGNECEKWDGNESITLVDVVNK